MTGIGTTIGGLPLVLVLAIAVSIAMSLIIKRTGLGRGFARRAPTRSRPTAWECACRRCDSVRYRRCRRSRGARGVCALLEDRHRRRQHRAGAHADVGHRDRHRGGKHLRRLGFGDRGRSRGNAATDDHEFAVFPRPCRSRGSTGCRARSCSSRRSCRWSRGSGDPAGHEVDGGPRSGWRRGGVRMSDSRGYRDAALRCARGSDLVGERRCTTLPLSRRRRNWIIVRFWASHLSSRDGQRHHER